MQVIHVFLYVEAILSCYDKIYEFDLNINSIRKKLSFLVKKISYWFPNYVEEKDAEKRNPFLETYDDKYRYLWADEQFRYKQKEELY